MSASASRVIGVDIGGANLKFAAVDGHTHSVPFPMWKLHHQLSACLRAGLEQFKFTSESCLAVTMTGELADCFATRREGVMHILQQVCQIHPRDRVYVYTVDGQWRSPGDVTQLPLNAAASNWHALSSWLASSEALPQRALRLVIDIGSTTVDVIPIHERCVATSARTDRQRLELGQLVYTGCERTPVAAILDSVLIDRRVCPLMAERFADSLDAYLALGAAVEDVESLDTADGRPRTQKCAFARLARMVGEDAETLFPETIKDMANQIVEAQVTKIVAAILNNLPSDVSSFDIAFSGHGQELAVRVQRRLSTALANREPRFLALEEHISASVSRCAPAMAVACLLEKHLAG